MHQLYTKNYYNIWSFKMINVEKDENFVSVTVKMDKRVKAKDPKAYFYTLDALREAKEKFPELDIIQNPEKHHVVSNVRVPHEATWKFKIRAQPKTSKETEEPKKDLNFQTKRAKVERSVELREEASTSDE